MNEKADAAVKRLVNEIQGTLRDAELVKKYASPMPPLADLTDTRLGWLENNLVLLKELYAGRLQTTLARMEAVKNERELRRGPSQSRGAA